ncbi:pyridoxamine 5'-phosphate oxidase family protein [Mycolicibacterium psychrotolerans]|uniref:Pyridoxamine 5'-phosphate oxidase n=1 Tax=Mycolicibacterium psychrotolerans TaxID=216929 RepID=A0A7I7MCF5_9MYCO|nr:pyridoxamine 5'-phosphate oxidase family protein [Mycolicibacterium psychrotolerans]BBX69981.1 hypothetical protein MPSYJ_34420 [Mycolicibacterium psychrotolerans]
MLGDLDAADVEAELRGGVVGRIGCLSSGRPYVVPVCYVYHEGCVYGHSMPGAKLTALSHDDTVCFEVENITDLSNWRSVIAWGTAELLQGSAARDGLNLLLDRLAPVLGPEFAAAHAAAHSGAEFTGTVYRIHLAEKTGRFETGSG